MTYKTKIRKEKNADEYHKNGNKKFLNKFEKIKKWKNLKEKNLIKYEIIKENIKKLLV